MDCRKFPLSFAKSVAVTMLQQPSLASAGVLANDTGSELLIMSMQAAATRTEKRHRLMAYPDRCRPPGRTTCLRPRISFALLF